MPDIFRGLLYAVFQDTLAHIEALFNSLNENGELNKDSIELQIATAKYCNELYCKICDELSRYDALPDDLKP
jgi:hypothetical protein